MRTPQDVVQAEVLCCLSSLVSTLAADYGDMQSAEISQPTRDLAEQAFELACPIDDWEEAALESGWVKDGAWRGYDHDKYPSWIAAEANGECNSHDAAQQICESNDIDPYAREVFEHWAVTDWFADKLIEAGEKVDKDFAGLCVWARTTTGQAIYADGVIERIAAEHCGWVKP